MEIHAAPRFEIDPSGRQRTTLTRTAGPLAVRLELGTRGSQGGLRGEDASSVETVEEPWPAKRTLVSGRLTMERWARAQRGRARNRDDV